MFYSNVSVKIVLSKFLLNSYTLVLDLIITKLTPTTQSWRVMENLLKSHGILFEMFCTNLVIWEPTWPSWGCLNSYSLTRFVMLSGRIVNDIL